MDLLVLADSEGVVDMTPEAISRRTNVPIDEVQKYLVDLCQPDIKSRSQLHEGKRLIPLDPNRDWGWIIVNYQHYREIRDEEARREYFRDAMRKYRAKNKKENVKDKSLTDLTSFNKVQLPASASASVSFLEELKRNPFNSGVDIDAELEKAQRWCVRNKRRCTQRFFERWVAKADRLVVTPTSKPKAVQPPLPNGDVPMSDEKRLEISRQMKNLCQNLRMTK